METEDLTADVIRKALGMTASHVYCARASSAHLTHKARNGNGAVARLGCKSWACMGCSGRLRLAYGQTLAVHILNASAVSETRTTEAGWSGLKKRMNRAGAEYVKVAEPDGQYTVLHTGQSCGRTLTTLEAITRLGELLRGIQHTAKGKRFRPVVTSGRWKLPVRESEYRFAGLVPYANPDRVRKALEADGAKVRKVDTDGGGWMLVYQKDDGPADLSKPG